MLVDGDGKGFGGKRSPWIQHLFQLIFKPRTHGLWPHTPGFLKSLLFTHQYVCVFVCVSAPEAIQNKSCETHA